VIKNDIDFIKSFKGAVYNDKLLEINFDECFKNNYFLIMSNIYHINLKKMQNNFIKEYVNRNFKFFNSDHIIKTLDTIYEKTIRETREFVLKHYQVNKDHFEYKTILTLYYYYLSPYHPIRIRVEKLNYYFSEIRKGISFGFKFTLLENKENEQENIINIIFIFNPRIK